MKRSQRFWRTETISASAALLAVYFAIGSEYKKVMIRTLAGALSIPTLHKSSNTHDAQPILSPPGAIATAGEASAGNRTNTVRGFIKNEGQVDSQVAYYSTAGCQTVWFTTGRLIFDLIRPTANSSSLSSSGRDFGEGRKKRSFASERLVFTQAFEGASGAADIEPLDVLPGTLNYFIGNDPARWRSGIRSYRELVYRDIYDGIDLRIYEKGIHLEQEFIVKSGSDPSVIRVSYSGIDGLHVNDDGSLSIRTAFGLLKERQPKVYQRINGHQVAVQSRFKLLNDTAYTFEIGAYRRDYALVIDPTLEFSTYLGGNSPLGGDQGSAVAVDSNGNAYVVGTTSPPMDFPVTTGAFQTQTINLSSLAVVAKLDTIRNALVYSTFLGGTSFDQGHSIAVDTSGSAYVTGNVSSTNFPTTVGALQRSKGSLSQDVFVTKLNPSGSGLVYSTYLGGTRDEDSPAIAIDASGNAYVTGDTRSSDFPTTSEAFQKPPIGPASADAFVAKLNTSGSALTYATYLGGSGQDYGNAIALDGSGNAYVTGTTNSADFPVTPGSFQGPALGSAFVTKVNSTGSGLVYSARFGGAIANAITVDSSGSAYITGEANSGLPVTPGAFKTSTESSRDGFLTKLTGTGDGLAYSTFLGGRYGILIGHGVAVDLLGNAHVTGEILGFDEYDLPSTADGFQPQPGGSYDAFVKKFNPNGTAQIYSTYLGGNGWDSGADIAVDSAGNAYVTGYTESSDFPITESPQMVYRPRRDAFVAKISDKDASSATYSTTLFVPVVLSASGINNSFFTSEMTLTNRGGKPANIEFTYTAAFGGGGGTASDVLPAGQQKIIPDAIAYLKTIGVPLPDAGSRGGTLRVHFSGLSSSYDAAVTVRTTTAVSGGAAGLAYRAVTPSAAPTGDRVYLCGLRQNATDRSNVAIQNVGSPSEGDVVLRLTVISGESAVTKTLVDERLSPGQFKQFSGILGLEGLSLSNGFVRVERVSGSAPFYTYAVVNDQANSDGSFIPPIQETPLLGRTGLVLPVLVENASFSTELVITNWGAGPRTLLADFVADAVQTSDNTARFTINIGAQRQQIVPNFVQTLRLAGTVGIGAAGPAYVGSLFIRSEGVADLRGVSIAARTSTPGGGGRFGLFYVAVSTGSGGHATEKSTWLYGLQQNSQNRTNLALINTGAGGLFSIEFDIEVFDGNTGRLAGKLQRISLGARKWMQFGNFLSQFGVQQGYARVTLTLSGNPFITYAVINDGGQPGERTGDGAFIASSP